MTAERTALDEAAELLGRYVLDLDRAQREIADLRRQLAGDTRPQCWRCGQAICPASAADGTGLPCEEKVAIEHGGPDVAAESDSIQDCACGRSAPEMRGGIWILRCLCGYSAESKVSAEDVRRVWREEQAKRKAPAVEPLKPCQCGQPDPFVTEDRGNYYVECSATSKCGIAIIGRDTEAEARAAWNALPR